MDVSLGPDELVGAWRPNSRRLLLPWREPLRLQQRIAARIRAVGPGVSATITGHVASSSRSGTVFRIELAPDETRMRAVEWLLSVARGGAVHLQPRAPRFLATVPAVVYRPGGPTYMTTFSVSERGCGLAWTGPLPDVGAPMDVRLGAGNQAAAFHSLVCWTERSGRIPTVGLRFLEGAKSAWATMLADVKLSGAPPA
jgi:PilZ domain-containing protein